MNKTVTIKNTRIIFRNFSGKERKNNQEGERTFCVVLDDSTAEQLIKDKWDVRYIPGIEDKDKPKPYVQVTINPNTFFPSVILLDETSRRILNEDNIERLNKVKIKSSDITINGYSWVVGSHRGVKVYLEELIATIEEN